jgi:hypothetical protein
MIHPASEASANLMLATFFFGVAGMIGLDSLLKAGFLTN